MYQSCVKGCKISYVTYYVFSFSSNLLQNDRTNCRQSKNLQFFWNSLEDRVKIKIPSEILPPLSDQIGGCRLEQNQSGTTMYWQYSTPTHFTIAETTLKYSVFSHKQLMKWRKFCTAKFCIYFLQYSRSTIPHSQIYTVNFRPQK